MSKLHQNENIFSQSLEVFYFHADIFCLVVHSCTRILNGIIFSGTSTFSDVTE